MAFTKNDREQFLKEVKEKNSQSSNPVNIKFTESGKSVYVNNTKYSDKHLASNSKQWES